MTANKLFPQSQANFANQLAEIATGLRKDILRIKQQMEGRGILYSSLTIHQIHDSADDAVKAMGEAAAESAKRAFEAGNRKFSDALEAELLDAFEANLSQGLKTLLAIRSSEVETIARGLQNAQLQERSEFPDAGRQALERGQLELRGYFQDQKQKQPRWYDRIPVIGALLTALAKIF